MTNEIKLTHEQKVQQKELIQRFLQSEEIVGTKCRYGIEFTLPYKQKPTVSLRRHWNLSHEEPITGYTLEGELDGKHISFYEDNAHNKFFESIFEHIAKNSVKKHEEKIENEKQSLERMIKEDSEKTLNNKLEIETDYKFNINFYWLLPTASTSYKPVDIYTATVKNIQFRKGDGETEQGLGFKIFGDVELSKKEKITKTKRIDIPLIHKIYGLRLKKEERENLMPWQIVLRKEELKDVWTTSNYDISCTFYEQRKGDVGVVPYGKPVWINQGEDSDWYVTKIQEHLKRHKIELSENTLKELFNPMFEQLHFSDMIRIYNGNKK